MIANAKAVAHGIRAMLYVSGESRNKKHPEKIMRICDNFMPQDMDATGIWTEMKFATMNHPNIKNNVIRMEISPAMEHTEDFTLDDLAETVVRLRGGFRRAGNPGQGRQGRFSTHQRIGQQVLRMVARGIQERHTSPTCCCLPGGRGREHQQRPRHPPPGATGG